MDVKTRLQSLWLAALILGFIALPQGWSDPTKEKKSSRSSTVENGVVAEPSSDESGGEEASRPIDTERLFRSEAPTEEVDVIEPLPRSEAETREVGPPPPPDQAELSEGNRYASVREFKGTEFYQPSTKKIFHVTPQGKGGFARVFLGLTGEKDQSQRVALKVYFNDQADKFAHMKQASRWLAPLMVKYPKVIVPLLEVTELIHGEDQALYEQNPNDPAIRRYPSVTMPFYDNNYYQVRSSLRIGNELDSYEIAKRIRLIHLLVRDVAHAAASMHQVGVLHQDLDLSNIAATASVKRYEIPSHRFIALDFDLAQPLEGARYDSSLRGKWGKFPPEAFRKGKIHPSSDLFPIAADVWSLLMDSYEPPMLNYFREFIEKTTESARLQVRADTNTVQWNEGDPYRRENSETEQPRVRISPEGQANPEGSRGTQSVKFDPQGRAEAGEGVKSAQSEVEAPILGKKGEYGDFAYGIYSDPDKLALYRKWIRERLLARIAELRLSDQSATEFYRLAQLVELSQYRDPTLRAELLNEAGLIQFDTKGRVLGAGDAFLDRPEIKKLNAKLDAQKVFEQRRRDRRSPKKIARRFLNWCIGQIGQD